VTFAAARPGNRDRSFWLGRSERLIEVDAMRVPESQKLCLSRRIVGSGGDAGPGVTQGAGAQAGGQPLQTRISDTDAFGICGDSAACSIAPCLGAPKVRCVKKKVR
jgi:hypothetical protein